MATIALRAPPFGAAIAAVLLVMGGILRMAYALMFESPVASGIKLEEDLVTGARPFLDGPGNHALPPQQSYPVSSYVSPATGNWRDTSDLEPRSVTEGTTKLLENDENHQ